MEKNVQVVKPAGLALVASCLLIVACSSAPSRSPAEQAGAKDALYKQYSQWRGVPYRLGGDSRSGVDCSALVQITYKDAFAMHLPRNTDAQAKVGDKVNRGKEQSGDLVFFKTGFWRKHVGIYLENGNFMHASARSGVTISNLAEPYWQERYWKSRRP